MKQAIKSIIVGTLKTLTPDPQHPILDPRALNLNWRIGTLKQKYYQLKFSMLHRLGLAPKILWGQRISIQGRMRAVGPGTVTLGDDCIIGMNTDFYTHNTDAKLQIGARSFLNGTRFGCDLNILVGNDCILADVRIMDTDFHPITPDRMTNPKAKIGRASIRIHNNVWVAANSGILRGSEIGENSVVGYGSIVTGKIPSDVIAAGNPAKVLKALSEYKVEPTDG